MELLENISDDKKETLIKYFFAENHMLSTLIEGMTVDRNNA